ncbi:MAG: LamG-like jellyroll fold domain-containing protein [Verrucomicrobiota bacterium]
MKFNHQSSESSETSNSQARRSHPRASIRHGFGKRHLFQSRISGGGLFLLLVCFLLATPVLSQTPAPNRILELDGNESYVELPNHIFTNLTEATIEAWAAWDRLELYSRFYSVGSFGADGGVGIWEKGRVLHLFFGHRNQSVQSAVLNAHGFDTNQWAHWAAVTGPGGMQLFVNGHLVASNRFEGSFAGLPETRPHSIGRQNDGPFFTGRVDELRIWSRRRSQQEIRSNLFTRLTGKEEGLAALWNFDDGTARDASTNRYHGTLKGNARVVVAEVPSERQSLRDYRETEGKPVARPGANVNVLVTALDNSPLSGVVVEAMSIAVGPPELRVGGVSDLSGKVTFTDLPAGAYRVACHGGTANMDRLLERQFDIEGSAPVSVSFALRPIVQGSWRVFTSREGLLNDSVSAIYSSTNGLLWIGTETGLDQFDGSTFKHFTSKNGFVDETVWSLHGTSDGTLWIGTGNGLFRFHGGKLIREELPPHSSADPKIIIYSIGGDHADRMHFGTSSGILERTGAAYAWRSPVAAGLTVYSTMLHQGELFVSTAFGAVVLGAGNYRRIQAPGSSSDVFQSMAVWKNRICFGSIDGKVFVLEEGGLHERLSSADGIPSSGIWCMSPTTDGTLWLGTTAGLLRYDGESVISFAHHEAFQGRGVRSLHEDSSGALWIGLRGGGLVRYDPEAMAHYTRRDGLAGNRITSSAMEKDNSILFVSVGAGTDPRGEVVRWDGNAFQPVLPEAARQIKRAPDGALWLATARGALRYHGNETTRFTTQEGLLGDDVRAIDFSGDGSVWIALFAIPGGTRRLGARRRLPLSKRQLRTSHSHREHVGQPLH